MNKNTKLTFLLGLCLILLFAVIGYKFLLPVYDDWKKEADANEQIAKKANRTLDGASGLSEKKITDRLKKLQARVPNSLELPNVIKKINEKADAADLVWVEGTPEDVLAQAQNAAAATTADATSTVSPNAPQLNNHEVSITVVGNIYNLIVFMESITNKSVGRIVVITSIKVTPETSTDGQAGDPDMVRTQMQLNIVGWDGGKNIDISGCLNNTANTDEDCSVLN